MEIKNIEKVELIIQEINALKNFIAQLPDNSKPSEQIIFGNEQTGVAELKTVFKGKNLKKYIEDLKCLVFKNADAKLKELGESLREL